MKADRLNILVHTDDYRGDHSADVAIALVPKEGETVVDLVERAGLRGTDRIEIRVEQFHAKGVPA